MRLFVALDFPDAVRDAVRILIARLKPESRSAKWVRPEAMHVTLKFIGEVPAETLDPIRAALTAVHFTQPVDMQFHGLGFFPNDRRPRVLWCGVEASPQLAEVAASVDRALVPLGIPAESRGFVPHLTLARFQAAAGSRGDLEKLVRAACELKSYDFGRTRETEFHLIESKLKPSGAEYRRLQTYPIVKGSG
ncbi:MAG: RNA 2',3'-cyclic phosphodiesterase [Candidatus Acidiferrales bacterium]